LRHQILLRIKAFGHSIQADVPRSGRCGNERSERIFRENATYITRCAGPWIAMRQ
jgi:hypothetical protein